MLAEESHLAGFALSLPGLRLSERGVERRHELGAVPAERVAGAGVDERLEDALVAEAQVDPIAQVDERAVRPPRGPPGENRLDRARADVLDRAEAEAEPAVADHRELEPGLVDVRRQHLEAELARLVDVAYDVVGIADLGGQQRPQELGRVV